MGSLSEFMGRLYERSLFQGKDVGRFYAHSASLGLYHLRPPAVPSLQTGEDKLRAIHHAVEFGIFLVDWMKNWYMNHSEDFIPIDLRLPMALPFGKEFPKWHQGIESERKFKESDDLFGTLRQLRGWCPCTHDDCPREDQFPIPEMREIDWEGISNIYNNTAYRIAWQRAGGPECMDITCSVLSYRLGVKVEWSSQEVECIGDYEKAFVPDFKKFERVNIPFCTNDGRYRHVTSLWTPCYACSDIAERNGEDFQNETTLKHAPCKDVLYTIHFIPPPLKVTSHKRAMVSKDEDVSKRQK